jgi:hypothetical protein
MEKVFVLLKKSVIGIGTWQQEPRQLPEAVNLPGTANTEYQLQNTDFKIPNTDSFLSHSSSECGYGGSQV